MTVRTAFRWIPYGPSPDRGGGAGVRLTGELAQGLSSIEICHGSVRSTPGNWPLGER